MTVLFLVPDIHDQQTGGNVFNRRIIEGLRPETTVRVIPWSPDETPVGHLDLSGANVVVVDSLLARHPDALRVLRETRLAGPLILLVHYLHCIDPRSPDADTATDERATLGVVDAAIATSRFVERALRDEGLAAGRTAVVRPGLDARYRGPRPDRLGRGAPRMLTVANLLPEKGLQSFVDGLRDLRDLPWTWTLVGDASLDPSYAAGVFRRLRAAGLDDRITWTGSVAPEALRGEYDRADLFVLPSRFETCSLSTREAMARGLPVVGHRVGGMAENFGDPAAGSLAPPDAPTALRDALRSLLTDPMARAWRGHAAWRRSRDFPTWDAAADRFRKRLATLRARVGGTAR
jgi:glycosyltransferase involved in cell wall biosynthesis